MTTEPTYTPKELAKELGIDPKDFRRWLRTLTDDRAGRGGTWVFSEETAAQLLAMYRAKPAKGKATSPVLKTITSDDDPDLDELTDELDDVDDIDELEV